MSITATIQTPSGFSTYTTASPRNSGRPRRTPRPLREESGVSQPSDFADARQRILNRDALCRSRFDRRHPPLNLRLPGRLHRRFNSTVPGHQNPVHQLGHDVRRQLLRLFDNLIQCDGHEADANESIEQTQTLRSGFVKVLASSSQTFLSPKFAILFQGAFLPHNYLDSSSYSFRL